MLMLDQLKCRGMTFSNRFFLCEEDKETIDHLLIYCKSAKMLWNLFLSIVRTSWISRIQSFTPFYLGKEPSWVKSAKKYG